MDINAKTISFASEADLDAAFAEHGEYSLAFVSNIGELLIVGQTEDGECFYQGLPMAEDEEGTTIDPNKGWVSDLRDIDLCAPAVRCHVPQPFLHRPGHEGPRRREEPAACRGARRPGMGAVMTGEIRHTTKALKLLQNAKSAETASQARILVADAQVHATLALVEQQRIANLIAVYSSTGEVESGYASKTVDFGYLADQIREGLGL